MLCNSELLPVTASLDRCPILCDVMADLSASGEPELPRDEIKTPPGTPGRAGRPGQRTAVTGTRA